MPLGIASVANQSCSMDFMSERFENGVYFLALTIIDLFTRECPLLWADISLTGPKVVACLDQLAAMRGLSQSVTVDNGAEFCIRPVDMGDPTKTA